jgi:hypothetical protein
MLVSYKLGFFDYCLSSNDHPTPIITNFFEVIDWNREIWKEKTTATLQNYHTKLNRNKPICHFIEIPFEL